jgi:hypothetical protein
MRSTGQSPQQQQRTRRRAGRARERRRLLRKVSRPRWVKGVLIQSSGLSSPKGSHPAQPRDRLQYLSPGLQVSRVCSGIQETGSLSFSLSGGRAASSSFSADPTSLFPPLSPLFSPSQEAAATSTEDVNHDDLGSGVKATAASLAHATEHLKAATDALKKKKEEADATEVGGCAECSDEGGGGS